MQSKLVIILIMLILSCERGNKTIESNNDSIFVKDTIINIENDVVNLTKEEYTVLENGEAEITKLPFIAHFDSENMKDLVRNKRETYKLPLIKDIFYINPDSSQTLSCYDKVEIDSVFNFFRFRYRFPDIGQNNVYLVCDTTFIDYKLNKDLQFLCKNHIYYTHAYLVLFDTITSHANVILLFSKSYDFRRTFDIDENYNIHLLDHELSTQDEYAEEIPTSKYDILIKNNGDIELTTPQRGWVDEYSKKLTVIAPSYCKVISNEGKTKSIKAIK